MEYLENGTLQNYLSNNKKNNFDEKAFKILKQIAEGISYLHNNGIIHRDLKHENILIGKNNIIKIADFGLSKIMSRNETTNESYGTLVFSAPEILLKKNNNEKIDVWSFGVICYFMVLGKLPFDVIGGSIHEIANKISNEEVKFPSSFNNENLKIFIMNCLQKNYEKRFSINEVINSLN